MEWEQILPSIVAITIAIISPLLAAWSTRKSSEADIHDDQSSAFDRYWKRIRDLETENEKLKDKIYELERQNRRLSAELGNLYLQIANIDSNRKDG